MPPMLIAAVTTITAALVLYTIGVFAERRRGRLEARHLVFFWAGFAFDTTGTTIMSLIARGSDGAVTPLHAATGAIALILMAFHAGWATWIVRTDKESLREGFHKLSILVWLIWLIPYIIGMLLGIPGLALPEPAIIAVSFGAVALIGAALLLAARGLRSAERP